MADKMGEEFDDEEEEEEEIEYKRLKEAHGKAGYREGLQAGEEDSMQQGFNEGFAVTSVLAVELAKLRGAMSALLSYVTLREDQESKEGFIDDILNVMKEVQVLEHLTLEGATTNPTKNTTSVDHVTRTEEEREACLEHDKAILTNTTDVNEGIRTLTSENTNISQCECGNNSLKKNVCCKTDFSRDLAVSCTEVPERKHRGSSEARGYSNIFFCEGIEKLWLNFNELLIKAEVKLSREELLQLKTIFS